MGSITNIWETGVNNIQNGTNNHYYYITDDSSSLIKRLTIQSGTGTVGIDKNDPISITNTNVKLDVNGSINLSGNIYKNGILYVSNSTTWIENETKTKIYYMSGNVGINNSNPLELLDVNGNIKAINIIANGSGLTNLNADNIEYGKLTDNLFDSNINITGKLTVGELEVLGLSSSSIINTKNLEIINNNNTSNPSLIINHNSTFNDLLKISSTNNSRIFTILKDGNVGIGGTAFPNSNYKLDVDGNINSSGTISSQIVLIKDSINLYKSSTQSVLIKLPQTLTSYTITLPNTGPLANNILKSDDNGNLSWVNINDSLTLINIYSFFDSTEFEITTNIKLKNINSSKLLSAFNNNQFELPPNGEPQIIRIKDSILTSLQNVQNFNITSINDPPENTINTLNLELNNITNEPSIIYPKIKKIKLQGVSGNTSQNADIREFEFGGLGGWGSGNRKSGSYEINVTTNFITSQYPASPIVTKNDWVNGSNVAADPNSLYLANTQNVAGKYIEFNFIGSAPLPYINELINFKIYYDRADISGDGEEGTYNFIAINESNIEYNLFTFTISENNLITTPTQYYVNYNYIYPNIVTPSIPIDGINYQYHKLTYEYNSRYISILDENQRTYNINFSENVVADILIVGGGGAGGTYIGGGGGGGGVLHIEKATIPAGTYTIKVGKGGDRLVGGQNTGVNNNGRNSEAFGIVVYGGGAGGTGGYVVNSHGQNGANGGSGGGGGSCHTGLTPGLGGSKLNANITNSQITLTTYLNYGGNGANGMNYPGTGTAVGGNGGGGAGGNAPANTDGYNAGVGADGKQINIDGNNYYWGGGGGGGSYDGIGGNGGKGGGGGGNASEAGDGGGTGGTDGITLGQNGDLEGDGTPIGGNGGAGTGGGGGGCGNTSGSAVSGAGGSGIVIIRYYTMSNITHKYLEFINQSVYSLNFPVNTFCDVLVINNTQAYKASRLAFNGTYSIIVGSSKIQQNNTDLYVPNTNLSITDSITGTSITYNTNSPKVVIRYIIQEYKSAVATTNVIPTGYLKYEYNDWKVEDNGILTSKVLHNEICMTRYLSNNNYSMINIYEYCVVNVVNGQNISSDWYEIVKGKIIYIAKSGYAGAYPTYQNNFVGNILKIRLKSCSLENVYKSFLIDHNSYIHYINCTIKNITTGSILYNSQDININSSTFFSSPELFTNGINLSTNSIPTNVKHLLELKLFVNFDASTNSTTTIKQQTDKFYLFYEAF